MKSPTRNQVFVVWPPVWNAFDPHVAVPALCGYLAQQAIPVRQFDLNIDFFRYVVAETTVDALTGGPGADLPRPVRRAVSFVREYYRVLREEIPPGYEQRFSPDAERLLLSNALAVFNHYNPETRFSSLGIYHSGDADDSDYIADFAGRDRGNAFAAFYRAHFLPVLAEEMPKVVGISICGSFQLGAALTLARLIKALDSRILVVAGGAFFSSLPQMLFQRKTAEHVFQHVDAFVLNEGELPFVQLIRQVFADAPLEPQANVVLRSQPMVRNDPDLFLARNQIAAPVFEDGALAKYFRPVPHIPIEASRGCYWGRCTFCNLASGANGRYRPLPVDTIIELVKVLTARYQTSTVLFSTLAMAPSLLRALSNRLLAERLDVSWSAWIRPEETLTERDIDLCLGAGCTSLAVTPESFNTTTLARMRKGFVLDHLLRIVRHLVRTGLCDNVNIIPGFPGETVDDFFGTVHVCRELGIQGEFFPFCLLKNSEIYRKPADYGLEIREDPAKDLAVAVPFVYRDNPDLPSGIDLIRTAATRYPGAVFADNPLEGYTFDFRAPHREARFRSPDHRLSQEELIG